MKKTNDFGRDPIPLLEGVKFSVSMGKNLL